MYYDITDQVCGQADHAFRIVYYTLDNYSEILPIASQLHAYTSQI